MLLLQGRSLFEENRKVLPPISTASYGRTRNAYPCRAYTLPQPIQECLDTNLKHSLACFGHAPKYGMRPTSDCRTLSSLSDAAAGSIVVRGESAVAGRLSGAPFSRKLSLGPWGASIVTAAGVDIRPAARAFGICNPKRTVSNCGGR